MANAPEIEPYPELIIIEGNSLGSVSAPYIPKLYTYGVLIDETRVEPIHLAKAEQIILCESGGRHEGVWGKAGEYGIAQFMRKSFYYMAEQAGLENPNWYNKNQQVQLLIWALEKGIAKKHWTCYKNL